MAIAAPPGTPGNYVEGLRNAETNLGNLIADANRFTGGAEVGLQNGGGIRAIINAGNISVGTPSTCCLSPT